MKESNIHMYAHILNYNVMHLPFVYLGILIGVNPRKEGSRSLFWKSVERDYVNGGKKHSYWVEG